MEQNAVFSGSVDKTGIRYLQGQMASVYEQYQFRYSPEPFLCLIEYISNRTAGEFNRPLQYNE